jgi:Mg/Co/Ni transporter MgtE
MVLGTLAPREPARSSTIILTMVTDVMGFMAFLRRA